jgi:YidC/Oxa1 family membrane protein insertase
MQKLDRNSIIGFVLMAILLFAYLYTSTKNSNELQAKKKLYEDSIAKVQLVKQQQQLKVDTGSNSSSR